MDLKDDQHKLSFFFHQKKLWLELVDIAAKPKIGWPLALSGGLIL